MKKLALLAIMVCSATLATAQEHGRVLSSTPVIQQVGVPRQVCGNETVYGGGRTSGAGAVIGGIVGGAAGNAIGKGNGRAAATALGVIGGAVVGNQVESNNNPQYQTIQRCTTETYYENRTVGYDVTYEYAGRRYTTRTNSDPGAWIPLSVRPMGNEGYSTQPSYYPQPGVVSTQPGYVTPPATVIEYGYDRPYPPPAPAYNPYWR